MPSEGMATPTEMMKAGKYFLLLLWLFSCSNDMQVIHKIVDPDEEPDLTAYNMEMVYSDSAVLQMRMKAPVIKQFSSAKEPKDSFPEGIHVWMYEKTGALKAEITANWALHDHTTKTWEARSNVVISNSKGEKLESEQMFWNQEKGTVYSSKFTKYTSPTGNIATGRNGMFAKQDFSEFKLLSGYGTMIFSEKENEEIAR
ncbi:MAG: LPS export ABC transporter periplasmic protein LptC [Bacteroidales bacterium]|nr:LPS export ABC transporter periplasmic protein LptC [Bacteroidales bacterium]